MIPSTSARYREIKPLSASVYESVSKLLLYNALTASATSFFLFNLGYRSRSSSNIRTVSTPKIRRIRVPRTFSAPPVFFSGALWVSLKSSALTNLASWCYIPLYHWFFESGMNFQSHKSGRVYYQKAAIPLIARGFLMSDKIHYVNFMSFLSKYIIKTES